MQPLPRSAKIFGACLLDSTGLAVVGDISEGKVLGHMSGPIRLTGHSNYINSVAAVKGNDGESSFLAASASADHTLCVHNIDMSKKGAATCRLSRVFRGHRGPVRSVCFLNPTQIVSAGGHDDMSIRVWRTSGKSMALSLCGGRSCTHGGVMRGHSAPIECVCCVGGIGDTHLVASASLDESVRLWDVHALRNTVVLHGHRREALCVRAHPQQESLLLSSSDDRTVRLWDLRAGKTVAILGGVHSGSVYAIDFLGADMSSTCVSGGADGRLAAYDWRSVGDSSSTKGGPLFVQEGAHGIRAVNHLVIASPPLILGGADPAPIWTVGDDGCVRAWRCAPGGFENVTPHNGNALAVLHGCSAALAQHE